MFIHPNTVQRYGNGTIRAAAVQIFHKGQLIDQGQRAVFARALVGKLRARLLASALPPTNSRGRLSPTIAMRHSNRRRNQQTNTKDSC